MSPFLLALLLSLISATAYAGAAVLQERVAAATHEPSYAPLRNGGWWASVGLNGSGALLHVAALVYGSLSLVQPLGALTIVFALPIAALFAGKRAGRSAWTAAVMCTLGLAVILSLTGSGPAHELSLDSRLLLAAGTAVALGALVLTARRLGHRPAARSLTLAVASGTAFGMASVFTKAVTDDLTDFVSLGMIALLAPAGLMLSQAAYRGAGLAAPLATLTVVNPVVAAAVGIVAMGESFRYGMAGAAGVAVAGLVAAAGVFVLTARTESAPLPADAAALPAQREPVHRCSGAARVPGLPHARSRRDLRRPPRTAHRLLGAGREPRRVPRREYAGPPDHPGILAPEPAARTPEPVAAARRST
ncbi:DMT family transporter [Streptomyces sp. NPDC051940]|uniref:DMT family transporter n=1 Tax=Streptomyces sp. NPDC051940 TaxID=3155675 RepID=UPI00344A90E0